jgi:hypothetical protein
MTKWDDNCLVDCPQKCPHLKEDIDKFLGDLYGAKCTFLDTSLKMNMRTGYWSKRLKCPIPKPIKPFYVGRRETMELIMSELEEVAEQALLGEDTYISMSTVLGMLRSLDRFSPYRELLITKFMETVHISCNMARKWAIEKRDINF